MSDAVITDAPLPPPKGSTAGGRRRAGCAGRAPRSRFAPVDRLMHDLGMNGARRGKAVRTAIPDKNGRRAGDLLDRNLTPQQARGAR